ncbi:hypothetical protein CONLIGDRAFT_308757 [Coniochaeta ligniaria NRRL 30616]|uniref:Uncharacterized protein n=1 Tax=Coniochaeta ligniaria NRRL 30616 TaxID=1408157 RepID=A0A1J7JU62_9PEZI|nr:hypothetical protein CONLIGDRAFT_308757 [Coniochaeta ligniaria NRRL 30616]
MGSTQSRAGVLRDRANRGRSSASGRAGGEGGSRGASSGGKVAGRGVEAVGRGDGVCAPQGDGLGLGHSASGGGGAETICGRQKRKQKSGCYRWEMHLSDDVLLILRISTVKVVRLVGW